MAYEQDSEDQAPDEGGDEPQLNTLLESINIAEKLDEDKLQTIGHECKRGFDADLESCLEWQLQCEDHLKLAKQCVEEKTYPWPGASNVKYPLLSTAAMQFAARAYPSLVPSDGRIVKAKAIGKDPDGAKYQVAEAVSIYMSWQLMYEMESWEEDMDKMLIMLPIIGTMFKKTYWDPVKKINCSRLVLPSKLVVDYWSHSLKDAERISEIIELSPRKVKERQMSKLWLDVDLGDAVTPDSATNAPPVDEITPHEFIEQHTYLDLDDDDYREPYVVTFHRKTGKVVRIVARFDEDTIFTDEEGTLQKIEAIQYYTKFGFVPNPDGSFYDIGFGVLLGPLNESVNTLINQLIDAGHLSSLQSGFLGKGLRLRMGEQRFEPGEWKVVNATGEDLKKQIVPLPASQPSQTLFELMGSLITSGKELASVAEIFVGKMPGQNTPATTTMASIEQGMKVFTAVYKRIYRALSEEFNKLFVLNGKYLNDTEYADVVDMKVNKDDFDDDKHQIFPGADPTAVSQTEKLLKAQGLMEIMPMVPGMLDPVEVVNRMLEAQEQPNRQALFMKQVQETGQYQPPPDPRVQALQAKAQVDQAAGAQKMQSEAQKAELDSRDKQQQMLMDAASRRQEMEQKQQEGQLKVTSQVLADRARMDQAQQQHHQDMQHQNQQHQLDLAHAHQDHQASLAQGHEQSKAKVQQIKAQAKAKPKPKAAAKK
jgi:chaperonin GroES